MSLQIKTSNISNIIKNDKPKSKPRISDNININTENIFGNKSDNKVKTTISKFNIQKPSQKKIYIKTFENTDVLSKKINLKISETKTISKPFHKTITKTKVLSKEENKYNKNISVNNIFEDENNENPNNINNKLIKLMNNKTIKSICSNLKYKTTTFIQNKTRSINSSIKSLNTKNSPMNNPFNQRTINEWEFKSNNPFYHIEQPVSPMELEMAKFKKMKMQERKNTEKKIKIYPKMEFNSHNKTLKNMNVNILGKYKESFKTGKNEYDKNIFNLEKYRIPKINKEKTIKINNKIYPINYNNSNKFNNLYNESENNDNIQEYLSINNLIENEINKEKSTNNKGISSFLNIDKENITKTSSFLADSKIEKNNEKKAKKINKNQNINNYIKKYQYKFQDIQKVKKESSFNINKKNKNNNKIKNPKKNSNSNINLIKNNTNEGSLIQKNIDSKRKLLDKVKLSKNIKKPSLKKTILNRKDNLIKNERLHIFEILERYKMNNSIKSYFNIWKNLLIKKEEGKINRKIEAMKKNKNNIKFKKIINNEGAHFQSKKNTKLINIRNNENNKKRKEFEKEKNLSSDIININNKEEIAISKNSLIIEHKKSFNISNCKIKIENSIVTQGNQFNDNINKQDELINLRLNNELTSIIISNRENSINNNIQKNEQQNELKTSVDEINYINDKILMKKENNINNIFKGLANLKNFCNNKLFNLKTISLNKLKEADIFKRKIESIKRMNHTFLELSNSKIKYFFFKMKSFINIKQKIKGILELFKCIFGYYHNELQFSLNKIKEFVNYNKKIESIAIINRYIKEKIFENIKNQFIIFKIYVCKIKKIEGAKKIFNFCINKLSIHKNNSFFIFKSYIIQNKKIEGIKLIYNLYNKNSIKGKKFAFRNLKIYIKKLKYNQICKIFNCLIIKKQNKFAFNNLRILSNKLKGIENINNIFNKKKIIQNINVFNYLVNNDDFIIKKHYINYLVTIIYKFLLYNKGITFQRIKYFSEKKGNFYISKNREYKDKLIINNKLNKNITINNFNYINKSQDNIKSNNSSISFYSKKTSYIGKANTSKKWTNNKRINNTNFNFRIESKSRKIISPSPKDFISFSIPNNKEIKKKSKLQYNIDDNQNDENIWTINVEKWEINETVDDSFYNIKEEHCSINEINGI